MCGAEGWRVRVGIGVEMVCVCVCVCVTVRGYDRMCFRHVRIEKILNWIVYITVMAVRARRVVALASTVLNAIFFDLQLFPIQAYLPGV